MRPTGEGWPSKVATSGMGRELTREERERQQEHFSEELQAEKRRISREALEAEPLKREKEVLGRLTAAVIALAEDRSTPPTILNGADKVLREAAPRVLSAGNYRSEEALEQVVRGLTEGDVEEVKKRYKPYDLTEGDLEMFKRCEGGIDDQTMEEVTAFLLEKLEEVGVTQHSS